MCFGTINRVCLEWVTEKVDEVPHFDLSLLKRCLQECAPVVFGSLDSFSMTEFILVTLKGAERKDWMDLNMLRDVLLCPGTSPCLL